MLTLVRNRSAAGSGQMHYFVSFESGFLTPFPKISPGEIKSVAEFDQHVQGHHQAEGIG
jgi:hypothetical protein